MPLPNPFNIGFHTEVDPVSGEVVEQDGYISAIQICCYAVSFGCSVIIAHWLTLKTELRHINDIAVLLTVSLLMLVALVVMLALWRSQCARHLYVKNSHIPHDLSQSYYAGSHLWFKQKIRKVLPIMGIFLFFILGCFQDILYFVSDAYCYHSFIQCGGYVLARYTVSILFHITRFLFMGVTMLFCYIFHNRQMVKCTIVRYGLLSVLAAAIVLWFFTIIADSNGTFNDADDTIRNNCTNPDVSDDVIACIHEANHLYNTTGKFLPYLYALHLEFLLLVMEMILHLFCLAECVTKKAPSSRSSRSRTSTKRSSLSSLQKISRQNSSQISKHRYRLKALPQRRQTLEDLHSSEDECDTVTSSRGSSSRCTTIMADVHTEDLSDTGTLYHTAGESLLTSVELGESNQELGKSSVQTIPKDKYKESKTLDGTLKSGIQNGVSLGIKTQVKQPHVTQVKQLHDTQVKQPHDTEVKQPDDTQVKQPVDSTTGSSSQVELEHRDAPPDYSQVNQASQIKITQDIESVGTKPEVVAGRTKTLQDPCVTVRHPKKKKVPTATLR